MSFKISNSKHGLFAHIFRRTMVTDIVQGVIVARIDVNSFTI